MHKIHFLKCEYCDEKNIGLDFIDNKLSIIGYCNNCVLMSFKKVYLSIHPIKMSPGLVIELNDLEEFLKSSDEDEWEIRLLTQKEIDETCTTGEFKGW